MVSSSMGRDAHFAIEEEKCRNNPGDVLRDDKDRIRTTLVCKYVCEFEEGRSW